MAIFHRYVSQYQRVHACYFQNLHYGHVKDHSSLELVVSGHRFSDVCLPMWIYPIPRQKYAYFQNYRILSTEESGEGSHRCRTPVRQIYVLHLCEFSTFPTEFSMIMFPHCESLPPSGIYPVRQGNAGTWNTGAGIRQQK